MMRLFLLVPVVAMLLCCSAGGSTLNAPTELFVLAGQSNMVGFGEPIPAETLDPRILRYNADGSSSPATDPVFPYDATYDGSTQPGVGPAMAFAHTVIASDPTATVGLIPCAASGTKIAEWQRGQPLYTSCVAAVAAAVAHGGQVAGILFFQGESDAATLDGVAAWPAAFSAFAHNFRADINAPSARLVYAQLGNPPDNTAWHPLLPAWRQMQANQAQIALAQTIPNSAMILTGDLPYGVDDASADHFSPWVYDVIGQRFAAGWETDTAPAPVAASTGNLARGTVTLNWDGTSSESLPSYTTHSLGTTPAVVFTQASGTNEGIGLGFPIASTFSYTPTSFGVIAVTTDGSVPHAGAYDVFYWFALP